MAAINPILPRLNELAQFIKEKPEAFASGSHDVSISALAATKSVFDLSLQSETDSKPHIAGLLSSLAPSQAPQTRSQTLAKRKRKRSPSPPPLSKATFDNTPLKYLFIEGMDEAQVWAQLELRAKGICDILDLALEGELEEDEESGIIGVSSDERLQRALDALEDDEDEGLDAMDRDMDGGSLEGSGLSEESDEEDKYDSEDGQDLDENIVELRDPSSDEDSSQEDLPTSLLNVIRPQARKRKGRGHTGLDDGFFDLAAFNAETERAEAKSTSRGRLGDDDSDSDDMSIDLFAHLDGTEGLNEEDSENHLSEVLYRDFFEPPPQLDKPRLKTNPHKNFPPRSSGQVRFHDEVRVKKIRAKGKGLPLNGPDEDDSDENDDDEAGSDDESPDNSYSSHGDDDDAMIGESEEYDDLEEDHDGEGRNTIERLKNDLFADEVDDQLTDLSTHEKRVAILQKQIAEMESANVGPKDWVLMGEADSRTRPQNSLLEEDLEFERVMKAVPVITEETVQVLEERIKARILEGRFDDVVRIRAVGDKPFLPSRFFELKDTKSTQSLAQIYEADFLETQADGVTKDDRDGKLEKEHNELEHLWENICGKLDALCNAHFIPKQPKATISTITNVSTAALESALPTTKSATTMLAPEEIFSPMAAQLRARSELTPVEKQALRAKERKAKQKSRDALDRTIDKYARVKSIGGVKRQKQAALQSVVKSGKGVTVVGKTKKDILPKTGRKEKR